MIGPAPIDAVVTWVDGGDTAWLRSFDGWSNRVRSDVGPDGRDPSRYRDNGELRYSLRAIARYAPWFRRIHVVTAGQIPTWFQPHDRIRFVDHTEILEPDSLPTFNSHAIEARLHRVPGLAERFVYFNDDVFLARPQRPADYFTDDGRPVVALDDVPLPDIDSSTGASVDLGALVALDLLRGEGAADVPDRRPSHGPFALTRSLLLELERRFASPLVATARHRFRSADDGVEGRLVPAGDIQALRSVLAALAGDDEARRTLGTAARARARHLPTWDQTAGAFYAACRAVTRLAPTGEIRSGGDDSVRVDD